MELFIIGTDALFVVGVAVGIIGLILIALAYPVYKIVTKERGKKISLQIIKLCKELMK